LTAVARQGFRNRMTLIKGFGTVLVTMHEIGLKFQQVSCNDDGHRSQA